MKVLKAAVVIGVAAGATVVVADVVVAATGAVGTPNVNPLYVVAAAAVVVMLAEAK